MIQATPPAIIETVVIALVSAGLGAVGVIALWRSRITVLERNIPTNLAERFALVEHRMDTFEKTAERLERGQENLGRMMEGVQARQRAELQMVAAIARKTGVDRRHVEDAVGRFITEDLDTLTGG